MELDQDFKEFIELLNEYQVKYLIIGGYAVNYYGYPRYTSDLDFWIWLTEKNINLLLEALQKFGFSSLNLEFKDFKDPDNIIQLGYEPYRIDLLVDVDGVNFEECYERKLATQLDGIYINFLSLNDLIVSKKAGTRLQDQADAEQLIKIQKKSNKSD